MSAEPSAGPSDAFSPEPSAGPSTAFSAEPSAGPSDAPRQVGAERRRWTLAVGLFVATVASVAYARGLAFGVPLMAILLSHELGHYLAARAHGTPTSPPYFLPMPFVPIGTFGAIIAVPGPVRSRNVMVDFAIAGPLAGLVVSLVAVVWGLAESPVAEVPAEGFIEGRSLLYLGILHALKGPIPEGMDVLLTPMALAGWVGLLVTMINLVPCGQLDGGHIAEAVVGRGYARFSRRVMAALCTFGLVVGALGVVRLRQGGTPPDQAWAGLAEGAPWLVWCALQLGIERLTRGRHPEDDAQSLALDQSEPLTAGRRALVALAFVCFVLLFMPWWTRTL